MATSDIAATALTAVATVKGNQLTITVSDPRNGALPHLGLDRIDVYGSTTNDIATASVVAQSTGVARLGTVRALHADAGDEQTWYYWAQPLDKLGNTGTRYPVSATSGVSCASLGQAGQAFTLNNGKLVASVAANALTIAIKTRAGNDPSPSDPVFIAFRNSNLASGDYSTRKITAALSLTITSGSTLGAANNEPFRVWVAAIDAGGTVELAAINFINGTTTNFNGLIVEDGLVSTSAEGGGGGADLAGFFYSNTPRSAVAFRWTGFLTWESGLATAGAWATAPSNIQLFGPGIRRPGEMIRCNHTPDSAAYSGSSTIPFDNTAPQVSEGTQFWNTTHTPTSAVNLIDLEAVINVTASAACKIIAALHDSSGATDALGTGWGQAQGVGDLVQITINARKKVGTSSTRAYAVRVGPASTTPATVYGNWDGAIAYFGSTLFSGIKVTEYMG